MSGQLGRWMSECLGRCLHGYKDEYMDRGTGGSLNGYVDGQVLMNWRMCVRVSE